MDLFHFSAVLTAGFNWITLKFLSSIFLKNQRQIHMVTMVRHVGVDRSGKGILFTTSSCMCVYLEESSQNDKERGRVPNMPTVVLIFVLLVVRMVFI